MWSLDPAGASCGGQYSSSRVLEGLDALGLRECGTPDQNFIDEGGLRKLGLQEVSAISGLWATTERCDPFRCSSEAKAVNRIPNLPSCRMRKARDVLEAKYASAAEMAGRGRNPCRTPFSDEL